MERTLKSIKKLIKEKKKDLAKREKLAFKYCKRCMMLGRLKGQRDIDEWLRQHKLHDTKPSFFSRLRQVIK